MLVHRQNLSGFLWFPSLSVVFFSPVEGKTRETISKGGVGPEGRICVLAALGHLSLERQDDDHSSLGEILWG